MHFCTWTYRVSILDYLISYSNSRALIFSWHLVSIIYLPIKMLSNLEASSQWGFILSIKYLMSFSDLRIDLRSIISQSVELNWRTLDDTELIPANIFLLSLHSFNYFSLKLESRIISVLFIINTYVDMYSRIGIKIDICQFEHKILSKSSK